MTSAEISQYCGTTSTACTNGATKTESVEYYDSTKTITYTCKNNAWVQGTATCTVTSKVNRDCTLKQSQSQTETCIAATPKYNTTTVHNKSDCSGDITSSKLMNSTRYTLKSTCNSACRINGVITACSTETRYLFRCESTGVHYDTKPNCSDNCSSSCTSVPQNVYKCPIMNFTCRTISGYTCSTGYSLKNNQCCKYSCLLFFNFII